MKSIKRNLKWAAKILSFLILLQSCTVYHSSTASVDEAVLSNNKVKVDVDDDYSYKFLKFVRIDGEIYGVAKKKSYVSKELQAQITNSTYEGKYDLIKLNDENLKSIHLKNKGASTALTVALPLLGVAAFLGIGALA